MRIPSVFAKGEVFRVRPDEEASHRTPFPSRRCTRMSRLGADPVLRAVLESELSPRFRLKEVQIT
jgi:hypothetical protein